MESYENRLATFKNWKKESKNLEGHLFAITGFFCSSRGEDDNTTCIFCEKSLEGWEDSDMPMQEHYSHSKKCPIFNLNNYIARKRMFEISRVEDRFDISFFAKSGFFYFQLRNDSPDDIFCFKCGFNLNTISSEDIKSEARIHSIMCTKNHFRNTSFDSKNFNHIFYIDLLKGKYNINIQRYISRKINIMVQIDENIIKNIGECVHSNQLLSVEEALIKNLEKEVLYLEDVFESDIKKSVKNFDQIAKTYQTM